MSFATVRRSIRGLLAGAGALALAGCMGPTYGTGVSQGQQMLNDIDNLVSLGSTNDTRISYAPRPELVKPAAIGALPPPRPASAAADPNWPEAPEVRTARIRAAAPDVGAAGDRVLPVDYASATDKEGYDPRVDAAPRRSRVGRRAEIESSWVSPDRIDSQSAEVAERARTARQGSPTQRRYLSEPPLAYRAPAATAPVGDPGVDEEVKERRAQGTRSVGSRIRDALPF